jgi:hypothetical protein
MHGREAVQSFFFQWCLTRKVLFYNQIGLLVELNCPQTKTETDTVINLTAKNGVLNENMRSHAK